MSTYPGGHFMKNSVKVLAILILISSLTSQSLTQVKFNLGLKTGLSFSTFSVDPDPYTGLAAQGISSTKSGGTGFQIGAVAELNFSRMFALAVEPGYTMKSAKWELTQGTAKASDERTLSYLQIPILFKAKFMDGPLRPYGFLGPNLGIVLSSKQKVAGFANVQDGEYDVKSTTSGLDFALDFGGGAEYWVNKQVAITGDVRYSLGLSNLVTNTQGGGTANSRAFQILFGALFAM